MTLSSFLYFLYLALPFFYRISRAGAIIAYASARAALPRRRRHHALTNAQLHRRHAFAAPKIFRILIFTLDFICEVLVIDDDGKLLLISYAIGLSTDEPEI